MSTFLTTAGIGRVYPELLLKGIEESDKERRGDILFKIGQGKAILLELKHFEIASHETSYALEDKFSKYLDKAVAQLDRYYGLIFADSRFTEIKAVQGIGIAVSWGHGVRVRIARNVERN
jgi:hypothetical protein